MGWLSGWAKRIKLTLDSDQIDAALSDFPVPVYLSAASGIGDVDVSCVFDELQSDANRKKIAITTSDGTTQCYVEIERWDHASEQAWLHVGVGSIAADADTDLYLYYDSSQSDNTTYVGDTGDAAAQAVWDSDFESLWHLSQDPSGGAEAIKDSTSNANHMTAAGSMASDDLIDAKFGKGLDFDGSNDAAQSKAEIWGAYGSNPRTIEVIFAATITSKCVFAYGVSSTGGRVELNCGTDQISVGVSGHLYGKSGLSLSGLNHVALIFPVGATSSDAWLIYLNGSQLSGLSTLAGSVQSVFTGTSVKPYLGRNVDGSIFFSGVLDEPRVSTVARSAAWLKATYHGLFDSLITFGSEETAIDAPNEFLAIHEPQSSIPPWQISGVVQEAGSPIARTVRAYKRSDGSLIGETTSDSGDGSYFFSDVPAEPVQVVALDDDAGEVYNDLIYRVLPKQVLN